jgi:hypothetical protein
MTITEDIRGNAWQWAVTLKGAPLADLKARAQQIREETKDAMTGYYLKQIDGDEIQMEFLKGEDA